MRWFALQFFLNFDFTGSLRIYSKLFIIEGKNYKWKFVNSFNRNVELSFITCILNWKI